MSRQTTGAFAATGQSSEVIGTGVSYFMTFAGTATVTLEFYDTTTSAWVTSRSHSASTTNNPNYIGDVIKRRWRLNCTAYTNGVTYVLQSGKAL